MGGRRRRAVGRLVVAGCIVVATSLAVDGAEAQVLPTPPALPVPDLPDEVDAVIALTGPTLGPVCGTASLLTLLTPSIAEGYFKIPLSQLVDSPTLRAYATAALHVCGFIPFPLTPTQCEVDRKIVDAVRGLSPLAAQVVGLFPQGATVDTVLAIEALLPGGPSVAGPLADQLSALMSCTRSAGPPQSPSTTAPVPLGEATPAPAAALAPEPLAAPALGSPTGGSPAIPAAPPAAVATGSTPLPDLIETRFVPRSGVQWAGVVAGVALLALSLAGWRRGRAT